MIPSWILLAACAGIASNVFSFCNRYLLRGQDDSMAYTWYFEALRSVFFTCFVVFDWRLIINFRSVILLCLLGATEMISAYYYMKMHAYSHLSVSTILSRTRIIWIPLLAFFLIRENLKITDYAGILILFGGLSVVLAPHNFFIDKGARYANVSAFMIALNTVILKMAVPYGSNSVLNLALVLPGALFFPLLMKEKKKKILSIFKKNLFLKTMAILINIVSVYLFLFSLRVGDVSKVNAIYQSMMVFSVIGGIVFLGERQDMIKKLLGTGLAILGVFLLSEKNTQ